MLVNADTLLGDVLTDPVKAQLATHDAQIANVTRFALQLEQRIGALEIGLLSSSDDEG
jgi:hypothetical protein